MRKANEIQLTPPQRERVLAELWENSIFNAELVSLVEKLVENAQSPHEIPADVLDEMYYALATLRNRKLITSDQQLTLHNAVVGFFGLSVGSHAAITWIMESRAKQVKIADPDIIDASNLNRIRSTWEEIGEYKTESVLHQMKKMSPTTEVIPTRKTDYETVAAMFTKPKLHAVVDEVDDLVCKVWLRKLAKKQSIPLVSATDVGDNLILEIERYDTEPNTQPFLGRVTSEKLENIDFAELPLKERVKITMDVVGFDACSYEMLDSLLHIGKTLKTWPQLGATSTAAGGIVTTALKKILLGEKINSGRYVISLDEILVSDYQGSKKAADRKMMIEKVKEKFDI